MPPAWRVRPLAASQLRLGQPASLVVAFAQEPFPFVFSNGFEFDQGVCAREEQDRTDTVWRVRGYSAGPKRRQ
jgi:hypothetical protein